MTNGFYACLRTMIPFIVLYIALAIEPVNYTKKVKIFNAICWALVWIDTTGTAFVIIYAPSMDFLATFYAVKSIFWICMIVPTLGTGLYIFYPRHELQGYQPI